VVPGVNSGCNKENFVIAEILSGRDALKACDDGSAVRKGAVCRRQEAPDRTSGVL